MAASALVLSKTRLAFVAVLTPSAGSADVYDEKDSADKAAPNVSCGAANAVEDPPNTGNFWVDAIITVVTPLSVDSDGVDPKDASQTLCMTIMNALEVDDLGAQLMAAVPDYTVFGFGEEKGHEIEVDGDCCKERLKLRVYCCPSDVTG
jgi:hypothetical protein